MKRILQIGPAPQNIGGVSIHIKRLVSLLKGDYSFDFVDEGKVRYPGVFNIRSLNIFLYLKKVFQADIVHIHSGHYILRLFNVFMCAIILRKRTIVTIHRDLSIEPFFKFTRWAVGCCNVVVCVSQVVYNMLYKQSSTCHYYVMPAFLPPDVESEPDLPADLLSWIDNVRQSDNNVLLVCNAVNLVLHENVDLYGLDMCIEMIRMLKTNDNLKNFYLLFVVANNNDQVLLMEQYKNNIFEYGISENVLIWESPVSFIRLILRADVVLRPTNTDGDAISIREALYLGKSVVASDVVPRPGGTVLFRNRDCVEFADKFVSVVSGWGLKNFNKECKDYRKFYHEIYRV